MLCGMGCPSLSDAGWAGNHPIHGIRVSTVAGNGKIGWRDHGVSTQAGFNYPTGLAIDRGTKTIYVSDRSNNCIRAIADIGNGAVTTVAGNCRAGTWGHRDGEVRLPRQGGARCPPICHMPGMSA